MMGESLQEFVDSRGAQLAVDGKGGVIRGVKVLGLTSRNGRQYAPEAVRSAAAMYEGAKVNVNHPSGAPHSPRGYQDRVGVVRNVVFCEGEGLFGDLHYNPKHALAQQLAWDAEHAPENVGLSHNVQARITRKGDVVLVEEILAVVSVDLVADPATSSGLFEQRLASAEALELEALRGEVSRLRGELAQARVLEEARSRILSRRVDPPPSVTDGKSLARLIRG